MSSRLKAESRSAQQFDRTSISDGADPASNSPLPPSDEASARWAAAQALRRSPLVKLGSRIRPAVNRAAARASLVPLTPLLDEAVLGWTESLRNHWREIAEEANAVLRTPELLPRLDEVSPDHERIAGDGRWRCFFLTGYGQQIPANCARAPRTAALVAGIPQLNSAFFSILEQGAVIPPHNGVTRGLLTWHLGLRTPRQPENCWMRVDNEKVHWREGEAILFDDTYRHEVRNDTPDHRIILLVQVKRPMSAPWRWLPDLFLWGIKRSTFVTKVRDNLARVEALAAHMERA
jgi:aspartyl/asparaginyl beta-hydroxylase (cupin superfamily)